MAGVIEWRLLLHLSALPIRNDRHVKHDSAHAGPRTPRYEGICSIAPQCGHRSGRRRRQWRLEGGVLVRRNLEWKAKKRCGEHSTSA